MAAAAASKQPKIHEAMLAVLGELGVAKNGALPSNMGGKPYITAADVAKEVKTLLVANGAFVLPHEKVVKHEILVSAQGRQTVAVVVEGEYTFVSAEDGSSVTVQGVGDGLATGTAVASNIASTNALKNAMLRTFMITEQSVEEQAKNGIGDEQPESRAVTAAQKGATTKSKPMAGVAVEELQQAIRAAWESREGEGDSGYVAFGNKITGLEPSQWTTNVTELQKVLKAIENGEA